jgi:hypothetical protein
VKLDLRVELILGRTSLCGSEVDELASAGESGTMNEKSLVKLIAGICAIGVIGIAAAVFWPSKPPAPAVQKQPAAYTPLAQGKTPRVLSSELILAKLKETTWGTNATPIPATVIDKGVMRHVPYQSFQCGGDREINIYGDPDFPCGVEVGLYRGLLNRDEAKRECISLAAAALGSQLDGDEVRKMPLTEGTQEVLGLTIEVTPSTAPDSYGGWWISVYDKQLLDLARLKPAELATITEPRPSPSTPVAAPLTSWAPSDYSRARPSSGGGSVYVKGYTRKDGTYVSGHTRRSARR